jgi:short-subunit dehydrogenase
MNVVILGALSGIATEIARLLASRGASLLLVGRDSERLEEAARDLRVRGAARVESEAMDLSHAESFGAMTKWRDLLGGIDAVVLAYGVLTDQTRASTDPAYASETLETNLVSAALWLLAAARFVSPSGSVVLLSSVAGDRGRQSNFVYGAAKAGLSAIGEGLAHRLAASGPRVVLVKLGQVDTPMTKDFKKGPLWAKPKAVSLSIVRAMEAGKNGTIYVPWFWRWIMLIIRAVPSRIFHRTKL